AAQVTDVAPSTVPKHFSEYLGAHCRSPRAEPFRAWPGVAERVDMRANWKRLPNDFFTDRVDAIIDNIVVQIPAYARAKTHGLQKHFPELKGNEHRVNAGATANAAAAIIKGKIRACHYSTKRWCGSAACDFYAK
ncbi:unnamed protein product, partial [Prorocentrum cordatum]